MATHPVGITRFGQKSLQASNYRLGQLQYGLRDATSAANFCNALGGFGHLNSNYLIYRRMEMIIKSPFTSVQGEVLSATVILIGKKQNFRIEILLKIIGVFLDGYVTNRKSVLIKH